MGMDWLNLGGLPEAMLPQPERVIEDRIQLAERGSQAAMYAWATGRLEAYVGQIAQAHAGDSLFGDCIKHPCGTCKAISRALSLVLAIEGRTGR